MWDARVSGSVITLQEGKLSRMVAAKETFEKCEPCCWTSGQSYIRSENGLRW